MVAGSLERPPPPSRPTGPGAPGGDGSPRPRVDRRHGRHGARQWGPIDTLVNNAIYQGPGRMDRVLDLDLEDATKLVVGNYVHQLHLIQLRGARRCSSGAAGAS